jgi:hypothetical protein
MPIHNTMKFKSRLEVASFVTRTRNVVSTLIPIVKSLTIDPKALEMLDTNLVPKPLTFWIVTHHMYI